MNASGALYALLGDFDIEAFAERIARGMMGKAREELPELGLLEDQQLLELLGAAVMEGANGLTSAVEMHLRVSGPEDDPALVALATTIEGIRTALAQLTTPGELPTEVREAATLQGLERLARIVTSWDASQLARSMPTDTEEPTG